MSSTPLKVAVTGAAGQIGYSLLFRLASGAGDRDLEGGRAHVVLLDRYGRDRFLR